MHTDYDILPWVSSLTRYSKTFFHKKLHGKYGIGENHIGLFIYLMHHDGVNQEAIAETFCKDKSSIGRSLKKLESLGYISRRKNPEDHRSFEIHLTPKAKKLAPELMSILREWRAAISAGIETDRLELLSETLKEMVENAKKEIKSNP